MASAIHVTPLFAGNDDPFCTVLKIDDFVILLDCGWDERFREADLSRLLQILPDIDAVVVSYPDIKHLGALPYLVKNGLDVPIYCTKPVMQLGQMCLYDAVLSRTRYQGCLTAFSLDDVDAVFEESKNSVGDKVRKVTCVEFMQPIHCTDKGAGITISPISNGHMLGGACWKIAKETQEIIYAVNIKHFKETHLEGTTIEVGGGGQTFMLITDAVNVQREVATSKTRKSELKKSIMEALKKNGNVLLPVDAVGRCLELLFILHAFWVEMKYYLHFPLVLLSKEGEQMMKFAEKLTEYMIADISTAVAQQTAANAVGNVGAGAAAAAAAAAGNANTFSTLFPKLHFCDSVEKLRLLKKPCVVLATSPTLDVGTFAQEVFFDWHTNPNSSIILTQRPPAYSLAAELLAIGKVQATKKVSLSEHELFVEFTRRVNLPLTGEELTAHRDKEKREAELARMEKQKMISSKDDDEDDDDEVDDDSDNASGGDSEGEGDVRMGGGKRLKQARRRPRARDSSRLLARSTVKSKYPMFAFEETKKEMDGYGEVFDVDALAVLHKQVWAPPEDDVDMVGMGYGSGGIGAGSGGADVGGVRRFVKREHLDGAAAFAAAMVPMKTVLDVKKVKVQCHVTFVDFEGLSDGRSIKKIIAKMKPRRLCLTNGAVMAKEDLVTYCFKEEVCKKGSIFTPKQNEVVDVTSETSGHRVMSIHPSLAKSLSFPFAKQIGAVEFELGYADVEIKMDLQKSAMPILHAANADVVTGHSGVFLGDFALPDMKKLLNSRGIKADIISGTLVCCGGAVNVRKVTKTKINISGALCDDYFKVRQLLYGKFEII